MDAHENSITAPDTKLEFRGVCPARFWGRMLRHWDYAPPGCELVAEICKQVRQGRTDLMRRAMLGAGALGILFLAGQLILWREFELAGYYAASNPANAFFYLITALHGLHIAGGLFFWVRAVLRLYAGADVRLPVELCAVYWHFLLLVWALMLALLTST